MPDIMKMIIVWFLGISSIAISLYLLYLKYRVVFTGEKCKGELVNIVDIDGGYTIGGFSVVSHIPRVKIKNRLYNATPGVLFVSLWKKRIGKEMYVWKSKKYGKTVYRCFNPWIDIFALLLCLFGVFLIFCAGSP